MPPVRTLSAVAAGVALLMAGSPDVGASPDLGGGHADGRLPAVAWARPATSVTSWAGHEVRSADVPWSDVVTVSPALGRTMLLQQHVGGRWLTRSTIGLADVETVYHPVTLTHHWKEQPVTRWRLLLPATADALALTTPVKRVEVRWEASDDPASPTVLVTKKRPLSPRDWEPPRPVRPDVATAGGNDRLRPEAARALERLAADARRATGRRLALASGYRSYDYQAGLHARYVDRHGRAHAETFSARAGHSEHQLGLAADVAQEGTSFTRFGETRSGRWVARHAWRYGYVVRYPSGGQERTGYQPEPWHLRYVGTSLAAYMHHAGVATLEDAFESPAERSGAS
jgi:D-alanyl-D-alanine carboxypeptidase